MIKCTIHVLKEEPESLVSYGKEHLLFHFPLYPPPDIRLGCAIPTTTHTDTRTTKQTLTHTSFMHNAPPNTHTRNRIFILDSNEAEWIAVIYIVIIHTELL